MNTPLDPSPTPPAGSADRSAPAHPRRRLRRWLQAWALLAGICVAAVAVAVILLDGTVVHVALHGDAPSLRITGTGADAPFLLVSLAVVLGVLLLLLVPLLLALAAGLVVLALALAAGGLAVAGIAALVGTAPVWGPVMLVVFLVRRRRTAATVRP